MNWFVEISAFDACILFVLWFAGIFLFFLYLIIKIIKYKYLFSPYNYPLFFLGLTHLLFGPYYLFSDAGWTDGFIYDSKDFYPQSLLINLIGIDIFLFSLINFEFLIISQINFNNFFLRMARSINLRVTYLFCVAAVVCWFAIISIYNEGMIPLFTGTRAWAEQQPQIRPFYKLTTDILSIFTPCFIMTWVENKKYLAALFIFPLTVLFTGHRGPLITQIIYPSLLYFIYHRYVQRNMMQKKFLSILFKMIFLLILFLILGLTLVYIRDQRDLSDGFFSELFYGNTFSDVRDGAVILYGKSSDRNSDLPYGGTYIADLISFIPSYLSDYRQKFSWGKYTAALFDLVDFGGFRGGISLCPFLGFGYIGIITFSMFMAYLYAYAEKHWQSFLYCKTKNFAKEFIVIKGLILGVAQIFCCSVAFTALYEFLILFIFFYLISFIFNA